MDTSDQKMTENAAANTKNMTRLELTLCDVASQVRLLARIQDQLKAHSPTL